MDSFHPATVYSSIDQRGRYAYGNQPAIAQWNLSGLAQTLLPLIDDEEEKAIELAREALRSFAKRFEDAYLTGMRRKLGLIEQREEDAPLIRDLLALMASNKADFTLTFRRLSELCDESPATNANARSLFENPVAFDEWAARWRERLADESQPASERQSMMRSTNPAFIPRNHLVEEVIVAAVEEDDLTPLGQLLEVLESPYDEQPGKERYAAPPRPEEIVHQTFCGT
jgi:uncharacterized protein YdiU (UPF0061 family)